MEIQFVDIGAHHAPLRGEIDRAIGQVIDESSFIHGEHVARFERSFAEYLGVSYCVGVGNGTDALSIALAGFGIGPGDEVITAANSFIATSEAITRVGAKVVFVDCESDTYTLDSEKVAAAVTQRTRAIIPVHLYGQPANMARLSDIARRHNLRLIEDAAQAHGAKYDGNLAGTIGDCGCFSFFPGKNLGAMGDAGAIVTNDGDAATRMRMFANHGRKDKYDHKFEGVNSRMDAIQAAVLSVKLQRLDAWNGRRREIAGRYNAAFAQHCGTPRERARATHVYHLYVVRVPMRDQVRSLLQQRGVSTGIHYPIPLPLLEAYRYLGHRPNDFPVACAVKDEILSLPIHGEMTDEQVSYVVDCFTETVEQLRCPAPRALCA